MRFQEHGRHCSAVAAVTASALLAILAVQHLGAGRLAGVGPRELPAALQQWRPWLSTPWTRAVNVSSNAVRLAALGRKGTSLRTCSHCLYLSQLMQRITNLSAAGHIRMPSAAASTALSVRCNRRSLRPTRGAHSASMDLNPLDGGCLTRAGAACRQALIGRRISYGMRTCSMPALRARRLPPSITCATATLKAASSSDTASSSAISPDRVQTKVPEARLRAVTECEATPGGMLGCHRFYLPGQRGHCTRVGSCCVPNGP